MRLSSAQMMDLWEQGEACQGLERGVLLLAVARPSAPREVLWDLPIAERDRALVAWLRAWHGERVRMRVRCPACQCELESELELAALEGAPAPVRLEVAGLSLRAPSSRDVAQALESADFAQARAQLARCCVVEAEAEPLSSELVAAIEAALERADTNAYVLLELCCAGCKHVWSEPFDVVQYLWSTEIEPRASELLRDVHTLAAAYGWSETQILALSERRRRAYLAQVRA